MGSGGRSRVLSREAALWGTDCPPPRQEATESVEMEDHQQENVAVSDRKDCRTAFIISFLSLFSYSVCALLL